MVQLPDTQVLDSKTFRRPPLEHESLTLPDLYDWHGKNSPGHAVFLFDEGNGNTRTIHWAEVAAAVRKAAQLITSKLEHRVISTKGQPVVAILSASDSITYSCLQVGILRAGFTAFPISPRNSPPAIAHLLAKSGSTHLLIGREPSIRTLASTALGNLPKGTLSVNVSEVPVFEDIFAPYETSSVSLDLPVLDMDSPALILHSSGSTDLPKIVQRSHRNLLQVAYAPWFGEADLCGLVMGCHGVPMFHAMGVLQTLLVASCGVIISVFKPTSPAVIPTPENVLDSALVAKSDFLCCVPSFIEAWSRDPTKLGPLKKFKRLIYGGGPLNKQAGDYLSSEGVSLQVTYGCTECGVMSTFLPKKPDEDWEYFTISSQYHAEFLPVDNGEIVEVVMKVHKIHTPAIINTKIVGVDAYATQDLLMSHPTKPGMWRIYGRMDDQIMHCTGEKTNAGPMEAILNQDPYIQSAVIFGRGRSQNGVIIEPRKEFTFDPSDKSSLSCFKNMIWSTVGHVNALAPTHSRIFKEMIIVAHPEKPFVYTPKGTARRQAVIAEYKPEIDALYNSVAQTTQNEIPSPANWEVSQCLNFIRLTVIAVLNRIIQDSDDIFQHGCDSLQAIWIRNYILRAACETRGVASTQLLPDNIIYQNPTISKLAFAVTDCILSKSDGERPKPIEQTREMIAMIERYSFHSPAQLVAQRPPSTLPATDGDVILLTGSTGSFGSNILQHLARSPLIKRVYALNRVSGRTSLEERQRESLKKRGLDSSIVHLPQITLFEGDLNEPGLGIDPSLLEEIRSSVTHIIHNAWRVDFNLSLTSFEGNISGLRNLVDFAITSPRFDLPRFIFVSSISVLKNYRGRSPVLEEPITDPAIPLGSGYSESKWVAERILNDAAEKTSLRPIIIRLGQLTGGRNGYWNEQEWFPSLVKSGLSVKCLPECPGTVSWLPPYEAAVALVKMRNSNHPILHLTHPRSIPTSRVMGHIACLLNVPLVPYSQWLSTLEDTLKDTSVPQAEQIRRNPALRILNFFHNVDLHKDKEFPGITKLSTKKAVQTSFKLKLLKHLGPGDFDAWLRAWSRTGYLGRIVPRAS